MQALGARPNITNQVERTRTSVAFTIASGRSPEARRPGRGDAADGLGRHVHLVQTAQVAARYAELTQHDTRDMLVQLYIEHREGGCPTHYRVMTLFGNVIYCARVGRTTPHKTLEEIA